MTTLFSADITDYYEVKNCGFETPCWVWKLALDKDGYAKLKRGRRTYRAARWFFERKFGHCPSILDHLCRNRACVNPDHLEGVSNAVNIRRGSSATLTESDVNAIRAALASGQSGVRSLARQYKVAPSTISRIKNDLRWASTGNA